MITCDKRRCVDKVCVVGMVLGSTKEKYFIYNRVRPFEPIIDQKIYKLKTSECK